MIALDTNVLLRYIVQDDPAKTRQASKIIEHAQISGERLFLSLLVLAETEWTLSRRYHFTREAIAVGLAQILETAVFEVEEPALFAACMASYRSGRAGLADYVIGAISEKAGCAETLTFDRDLKGVPGFRVL